MKTYRIAILPGDGIGKETVPMGMQVVQAAAESLGTFRLEQQTFPWGCEYYLETGEVMPEDAIEQLQKFDSIYFGAAGNPRVPDHLSAWRMIMVIRHRFDQYINLRPVKLLPGISSPLAGQTTENIDFVIVRENTEGELAGPGGFVHADSEDALAIQTSVFTRHGVKRVARYAFELARQRDGQVTNVTKSNALQYGLGFWDRMVEEVQREYPDIRYEKVYVDAAAMKMVLNPRCFDVILTTNMFGDILSDLGGAIMGGIGLGASGNINPQKCFPSMFEPIHGSAPDIAGKDLANPIGTILAGAMLLDHLGEPGAAEAIRKAVDSTLTDGLRTRDLGGNLGTQQMGAAVIERVREICQVKG